MYTATSWNFLDDGGDGVVQFRGDHVAALAGNDLQGSIVPKSGQNRVFHAVELNGFFQFLIVLALGVHGDGVVLRFHQIGGVKYDKDGFALLGGGKVLFGCLVRGRKPLWERLGDGSTNGALGGGAGDSGGGGLGRALLLDGFLLALLLGELLQPLNIGNDLLDKRVGVDRKSVV